MDCLWSWEDLWIYVHLIQIFGAGPQRQTELFKEVPPRTEKEELIVVGWLGLLTARNKDILSWIFLCTLESSKVSHQEMEESLL